MSQPEKISKYFQARAELDEILNHNELKVKKDEIALHLRKEGNKSYCRSEMVRAIEKYNASLCFAENDSEQIGLAYANRSSCYFQLNRYNECLIDIELAKKANYPERINGETQKQLFKGDRWRKASREN